MSAARVVVVGGGVGGTVAANRIARAGRKVAVTLLTSRDGHLYQPGLVEAALGRVPLERLEAAEHGLLDRRVRLVPRHAVAILPERRRVRLETGEEYPYDALVLATGSRPDTRSIPGFRDGAIHFHCRRRTPRVAEALERFRGGRVVLGAAGLPYKCPLSVVAFTLLLEEHLRRRGRRAGTSLTYIYPVPGVQPTPAESAEPARLLAERGVRIVAPFEIESVDPSLRRVLARDGRSVDYDLLVLAPPHTGAPLAATSGLAGPRGFIEVDPATLRATDGIYVLGDAAALDGPGNAAVPKLASAARLQAAVAAANVLAEVGGRPAAARYDGAATCLAATGGWRALRADYRYGAPPSVAPPGLAHYAAKAVLDRFYFRLIARA